MKAKWHFKLFVPFLLFSLAAIACGGMGVVTTTVAAPATHTAIATNTTTTDTTTATDTTKATNPDSSNSCAFSGVWGATHPAGPEQIAVQFQTDTGKFMLDRTGGGAPTVHVDGTFTYDVASGQMVMTNTAVQTSDTRFDACIGVAGTYSVSFPDCTHFKLTLLSDECGLRVMWANGATLTKQQ